MLGRTETRTRDTVYCQTIRTFRDISRDDRTRIATCCLRTPTDRLQENFCIDDFCSLPDPDVGLSVHVCHVEHTSFHFGLCGRKFVLCLFGQCPGICIICDSWQSAGVVHLSLQANGKVGFEDIPVFDVFRPSCHDSSLYISVMVVFY